MKTVFALSLSGLLLTIGTLAHATSPIYKAQALLEFTRGSGFFPYGGVISQRITLREDGSVKVTESSRTEPDGKVVTREYESEYYFDAQVMTKVQAAVRALTERHPAKLIDIDAKLPICMDAPGTDLQILRFDAKTPIAGISGCHTSLPRRPNQRRAAKYLLQDMQNLYKAISAK